MSHMVSDIGELIGQGHEGGKSLGFLAFLDTQKSFSRLFTNRPEQTAAPLATHLTGQTIKCIKDPIFSAFNPALEGTEDVNAPKASSSWDHHPRHVLSHEDSLHCHRKPHYLDKTRPKTEEEEESEESEASEEEEFFGLPSEYVEICTLGRGGHGTVLMAKDMVNERLVAVKRLLDAFGSQDRAKCCYRELHLLRTLHHPNLIKLYDAFTCNANRDLFLVTEYASSDLRGLLNQGEPLSRQRIRRIMYQLLLALGYLHRNGIVHRDLKPENLLLTDQDELKVCDFGLARRADSQMTGYLATRYYRAPEFMLTWRHYGPPVDLWSAGCVLAELARGKIMFPGSDHVHHLTLIIKTVGSPSKAVLERACSASTRQYLEMLPQCPRADFMALFAERLGVEGVDLLERLLEFDPTARITPAQALQHPFFGSFREEFLNGVIFPGSPSMKLSHILQTGEEDPSTDWFLQLRRELRHFCH